MFEKFIKDKGIDLHIFDPLNYYITILEEENLRIEEVAKRLNANIIENNLKENPKIIKSPFNTEEINALHRKVQHEKLAFGVTIKEYIQKFFTNIIFDESNFNNYIFNGKAYNEFILSQKPFNTREIILYIIENYGINEDYLSLQQIQLLTKFAVPAEQLKNKEINTVGKTGMRMFTMNPNAVRGITQFAQIVIGGEIPSFAIGWEHPKEGHEYTDGIIRSMTWYNKGKITVYFYNEEQLNKFFNAIFLPTKDIFKTLRLED